MGWPSRAQRPTPPLIGLGGIKPATHAHQNSSDAVATIGVDIGKNTFHLVGLDKRLAIVLRWVVVGSMATFCWSHSPQRSCVCGYSQTTVRNSLACCWWFAGWPAHAFHAAMRQLQTAPCSPTPERTRSRPRSPCPPPSATTLPAAATNSRSMAISPLPSIPWRLASPRSSTRRCRRNSGAAASARRWHGARSRMCAGRAEGGCQVPVHHGVHGQAPRVQRPPDVAAPPCIAAGAPSPLGDVADDLPPAFP